MKSWLGWLMALGIQLPLYAQENTQSLDQTINETVGQYTDPIVGFVFSTFQLGELSVPYVLVWLFIAALFFTFYFKFLNISGFGHALKIVSGRRKDVTGGNGEVNHFQALATALSGTVGLGNIAGVAVAVSIGGAGATFWMILVGLLGMSTKFVECSLGVK